MTRVFVVDHERRPLMPCTPARARIMLKSRKAAILRRFPLVLILKESRPEGVVEPLRLKIDPGAKTTGLAVVNAQTSRCNLITWFPAPKVAQIGPPTWFLHARRATNGKAIRIWSSFCRINP